MSDHHCVSRRHGRQSTVGPASGSNATFMCQRCRTPKLVRGRKRVGRGWDCAACVVVVAALEAAK